jgi:hypothetical protein
MKNQSGEIMLAGQQWTQAEIREQAERLAEQEKHSFCPDDEPGLADEPDAGQDETEAPRVGCKFDSGFILKCLGQTRSGMPNYTRPYTGALPLRSQRRGVVQVGGAEPKRKTRFQVRTEAGFQSGVI